ncbi:MAG: SMP-30/Gluconolaconase/LRE-like region-containing protein [Sphingobacteriales bacterium]|nr:SMP-30/Gluconolaconase/LRE-like region-containing protein [Sphingobacteriales bacterium]
MKKLIWSILFSLVLGTSFAQVPSENYPDNQASIEHPGVPKGEVLKFTFENSKIFPGTWREYWVYIPAQYKPDKPACVYVGQDGLALKAPTVFDNLIYQKEMPVTIGIFVNPGRLRAANDQLALDRFNRSLEYDGLGDAYAKFILQELLPDVEKQKASDGRIIRLSKSGNDRAIGGASSGAVCAFTVAWERPQEFSRVFSAIGTYVGLRGGDRYPNLIRKSEPKPIRIFLQDGSNDQNSYAGDWWMANQMMERSLTFAGYEVNHIWGEGAHNGKHPTAVFPDAMRWLWKDYPKPVVAGISANAFQKDILIPEEGWKLVAEGYKFTEGVVANALGEVFYQDIPNSKTYKVDTDGHVSALNLGSKKASGTAFGSDGKRYVVATGTSQVLCYDLNDKETVIANDIPGNDLVVAQNGNIYVTAPEGPEKPGKLYLVRPNGEKINVDVGLKYPNGLALTPDQTQLYVTESTSHWVWAYQIQPDGTLAYKQRFCWLYAPDISDNSWSDGIKCDRQGRIYVATNMGIQVIDQAGRVNVIMPLPAGQPSNLCFGGREFDTLYVTCGNKIFSRKLRVKGVNTFESPIKPDKPKL